MASIPGLSLPWEGFGGAWVLLASSRKWQRRRASTLAIMPREAEGPWREAPRVQRDHSKKRYLWLYEELPGGHSICGLRGAALPPWPQSYIPAAVTLSEAIRGPAESRARKWPPSLQCHFSSPCTVPPAPYIHGGFSFAGNISPRTPPAESSNYYTHPLPGPVIRSSIQCFICRL